MNTQKKLAILVGGSDLFLGLRGISRGTKVIREQIAPYYDDILMVNFNYFLDFGRSVSKLYQFITKYHDESHITLYGYSKGGEVVLQLSRLLEKNNKTINLLVTVDIANGPWSHKVKRDIPANVTKTVNAFQRKPNFPLRSYGLPAHSMHNISIENIDFTLQRIKGHTVSHSNLEWLIREKITAWLIEGQ